MLDSTRVSDGLAEAHRSAEIASNEQTRAYHFKGGRRLDRTRCLARMHPLSIWIWGAWVVLVPLSWSIAGQHHEGIGVALSGVVVILLLVIRWRLRQRRNRRAQNRYP